MAILTPHKKRANRFNYIPRYYDPRKEAREQRRAELCGERLDQSDEEYTPGKYIRTQREARNARRAMEQGAGRTRTLKLVMFALVVLFVILVLYPKVLSILSGENRPAQMSVESYYGDFDPTAPITIVPNDYVEPQDGDELQTEKVYD